MALTRAWRSNIRESLIDIVENLDPVPVVEFAVQQNGLSQDEVDAILEEPSTKTRVKKYLDLLDAMTDENFRRFVDGVSITGQGHVAGLITGSAKLMTACHKKFLVQNKERLEVFMDTDTMVTALRSRNVITSYDKQIITSQTDKSKRNAKLLEILTRKPDSAYHYFVEGLETTGQQHVAGLLLSKEERNLEEEIESLWRELEKIKDKEVVTETLNGDDGNVKPASNGLHSTTTQTTPQENGDAKRRTSELETWIENTTLQSPLRELDEDDERKLTQPEWDSTETRQTKENTEKRHRRESEPCKGIGSRSPRSKFEGMTPISEPDRKRYSCPGGTWMFEERKRHIRDYQRKVPEIIEHGESPMDRPYMDTQPNAVYIVNPGDPIRRDGQVMTWKFWARREAKVYFQIWRKENDYYYTLIGQTEVSVEMPGMQKANASSDNIFVKQGDLLGLYHPEESVIPFDTAHAVMAPMDFNWSPLEQDMKKGHRLQFKSHRNYWGPCRIYSLGLTLLAL